MIITRLEIGYGGVLSNNYEIIKDGHELIYRFGKYLSCMEFIRTPDTWEWYEFAQAVTPMVRGWKKEYFKDSRNGVQWRVNIETADGEYYSCGSNEFPQNFSSFLHHCRNILRRNDFARDYLRQCDAEPFETNAFNKRILRMLQTHRKSVQQLSDWLGYSTEIVRKQLHSRETFHQKDLVKICAFFNELPSDFMFETSLQSFPSVLREIHQYAKEMDTVVAETQKLIISYFKRTFVLN